MGEERSRGGGWVAGQLLLGAVAVVAGLLGPRWVDAVRVPFVVAGATLVVGGLAMVVAGALHLGPSLTPYPAPVVGAPLREDGLYGVVRHPIYGGALLVAVGWSALTSPAALAVAVVTSGFLELKSRREERWLLDRYPDYATYRRRVRWKFLPGLR